MILKLDGMGAPGTKKTADLTRGRNENMHYQVVVDFCFTGRNSSVSRKSSLLSSSWSEQSIVGPTVFT
jgi:hypothetical protein